MWAYVEQSRVTPPSIEFTSDMLVCYPAVLTSSCTTAETTSLSYVVDVPYTPCLFLEDQRMMISVITHQNLTHLSLSGYYPDNDGRQPDTADDHADQSVSDRPLDFECFKSKGLNFIHLNTRSRIPSLDELRVLSANAKCGAPRYDCNRSSRSVCHPIRFSLYTSPLYDSEFRTCSKFAPILLDEQWDWPIRAHHG